MVLTVSSNIQIPRRSAFGRADLFGRPLRCENNGKERVDGSRSVPGIQRVNRRSAFHEGARHQETAKQCKGRKGLLAGAISANSSRKRFERFLPEKIGHDSLCLRRTG